MLALLTALGVALATPARSDDGPSFECEKAATEAEEFICGDGELSRLDRLVADRFAAALVAARGLDAGAAAAKDDLRAAQRGWIKGRDDCWKAEDPRACMERAYLRREGELVAGWMLDTPAATAFWACDGDRANEVVTLFFDTALPSVRFQRGDTIDTGSLTRTASGSKYEGGFGRSIWIKGEEAVYREPYPDGREFGCTLVRRN